MAGRCEDCLLYTSIEDVYEPYLMQLGFLTRTPRGRVVMPVAYEHLGRKPQTPPKMCIRDR